MYTLQMALVDTVLLLIFQRFVEHGLELEDIPGILFFLDRPVSVVIVQALVVEINSLVNLIIVNHRILTQNTELPFDPEKCLLAETAEFK